MAGRTPASCATMPTRYYAYIDRVMVHEFGHTLGMPDFYADNTTGLNGLPAVMDNHHNNMAITVEDIAQLDAIYRRHSSHDAE